MWLCYLASGDFVFARDISLHSRALPKFTHAQHICTQYTHTPTLTYTHTHTHTHTCHSYLLSHNHTRTHIVIIAGGERITAL